MSSKTSAGSPPEFFVDRSLGRETARRLRAEGWILHLIADHYPGGAESVTDETWIAEGCRRGWSLLTKDKAIRYRSAELEALEVGTSIFCLARADWDIATMVSALTSARPRIERHIEANDGGFWHVHRDGTVRRMWP